MKRVSNQRQLRLISEISVTPFMDLILVLFFAVLVAVPLLKADKSLLPVVSAPAPGISAPATSAVLQVNADQSVTLDGALLARVNLPTALEQLARQHPNTGVEVRIHRELPVQTLVETMAMLKTAGIQKTAVTSHADAP